MPQHVFFVCRHCERKITGCPDNCPGPHRMEEVDCCAVCASKRTAPSGAQQ